MKEEARVKHAEEKRQVYEEKVERKRAKKEEKERGKRKRDGEVEEVEDRDGGWRPRNKIQKVRSVRRIPVEERWGEDCVGWVKFVPWRKYAGAEDADGELPERVEVEAEDLERGRGGGRREWGGDQDEGEATEGVPVIPHPHPPHRHISSTAQISPTLHNPPPTSPPPVSSSPTSPSGSCSLVATLRPDPRLPPPPHPSSSCRAPSPPS
jgi:hypothetical protein